ncbi:restriction endonuclease subunit S [Microbacterium aerolatum]|uniref:restriction endonuclease subunit S n=1 Tax=Microbacterium aerolatum TaxID=153731 RepID=UPI00384D03F7
MSRVDELITELCPSGVEFKPLGDIAELVRGNGMPKIDLVEQGVGAIHYGQIYTRYGIWATETLSFVTPETAVKLAKANPGDIIITNTSENLEDVSKAVAWLGAEQIVTGGHATVIRHNQNSKYLSYWFASEAFSNQKRKLATGTKVIDVSAKQLAKIRIPVPPPEVQAEIVRILDQFTQLEAELEAELEARQRQYEHYRSSLVRATQMGTKYSLGEIEDRGIVKLGRGKVISKITLAECPGGYPVYSSSGAGSGEFGRYGLYMFEDERITWSVDGGGRFFYRHPHRFSVTNVSGWMTVDTSVFRVKYLYYVLTVLWEAQSFDYTRKAHPSVIRDVYEIAIPSLETQDEVIALLDKFDALVNDIGVGLPAELTARRAQYEFYRNELLAFKERS